MILAKLEMLQCFSTERRRKASYFTEMNGLPAQGLNAVTVDRFMGELEQEGYIALSGNGYLLTESGSAFLADMKRRTTTGFRIQTASSRQPYVPSRMTANRAGADDFLAIASKGATAPQISRAPFFA